MLNTLRLSSKLNGIKKSSKLPYEVDRCVRAVKIPETPETFITKKRKSENITYAELKRHAKKQKEEGYDNTADMINLYMKISYPFMCVVFAKKNTFDLLG